jgi:hypothetical protein
VVTESRLEPVWNLVCGIEQRRQTDGVWKQGTVENICNKEGWNNKGLVETA